jgi:PAS domain S-box-containing protein
MSLFDLPDSVTALEDDDDAIVVINREGAVVLLNPPAEKLLGVSAEDMVGEFVEMLLPDNLRWGHQAYRRGYFADHNSREMDPGLDPHAQRPDGTLVPISIWLDTIQDGTDLYAVARIHERAA